MLSIQIRKCGNVEGFLLPGAGSLKVKVSHYADDATNFIKNERYLSHLLRVVSMYGLGPSSSSLSPRLCGLVSGEPTVLLLSV